jgi:hypothetical protein
LNKRNHASLLAVLFCAVIGIKGGLWVYHDTSLILESKSWIPTQGIIIKTWLETSWTKGTEMFSPMAEYSFDTQKGIVIGDRFEIPSTRSSSKDGELSRLSLYPVGSRQTIYYDPKNPDKSVILKPKFSYFFTFVLGGFSLLLTLASPILLFFYVKGTKVEQGAAANP